MLIKTQEEIKIISEAGKILRVILKDIKSMIKPNICAYDLENRFIELCNKYDVIPACKNYKEYNLPPFPTGLCLSINDEAVHCFPEKDRILKDGDTVAVDTVIKYKGYHADSAFTVGVGNINNDIKRFLETAQMAASSAFSMAKDGNTVGDIGYTMNSIMKLAGYNTLKEFVGHGIGKYMHEKPDIPCYGSKGSGMVLKEGMTIAIEALTCEGESEIIYTEKNPWKTRLKDGKHFAIFEHTILITKKCPIILT